jgi:penicillin amidase
VQSRSFGASQRLVVSPGREEDAILHLPCGQSGHPLSRHYDDGHKAWAIGESRPLLSGEAVTTFRLVPR